MNTFLVSFIHGIGFVLLWVIGMFLIPLVCTIGYIFFVESHDEEFNHLIFWSLFILYWIATALFLIFFKL